MIELLSPLTKDEIERLRTKKPARDYPPAENRLVIKRNDLLRMMAKGPYQNQRKRIVIPDDPKYHIADHPKRRNPESGAYVEPIATIDNPMSADRAAHWHSLGLDTDTANRPINPRALELLPTIGMYTGPGGYYTYGPQWVGNTMLGRLRNGMVEYAVVLAKRGSTDWGFPGGFAKINEDIYAAAFRETWEETGADLRTEQSRQALGGFVLTKHLARQKYTPRDTLHSFMVEGFVHALSIENPSLEGVELDSSMDPHILDVSWMDLETIANTSNFLGTHKKVAQLQQAGAL